MSTQTTNQLQSLLFFDIVTVRESTAFCDLPRAVQKTLMGRFTPLSRDNGDYDGYLIGDFHKPDHQDSYGQQGMFYPEVSKILGITTGMFVPAPNGELVTKLHTISNLDEEVPVIKNFYSLVERMKAKRKEDGLDDISLATFNGKRFDVPFLSKRSLINGIEIPTWIQTQGIKPWEHPVLDIMECWDFGGRYDYTSLANMAYAFGIRDLEFTPYHSADNLYHNCLVTVDGKLQRPLDMMLDGSHNDVLATMRLAQKLI